jgi:hypothetical protein
MGESLEEPMGIDPATFPDLPALGDWLATAHWLVAQHLAEEADDARRARAWRRLALRRRGRR